MEQVLVPKCEVFIQAGKITTNVICMIYFTSLVVANIKLCS